MFELVYPIEPAPLVPGCTAGAGAEILPIVEENGMVVGRAPRKCVHGRPELLHPVVHLQIIDHYGNIYLQKRSLSRELLPGYWDSAVGGHITYGESLLEALVREAGEELALVDFNPTYLESYPYRNASESELVNVFATITEREITPDNDEVDEGRWWTVAEVEAAIGKHILTPQFEQEFIRLKDSLLALL